LFPLRGKIVSIKEKPDRQKMAIRAISVTFFIAVIVLNLLLIMLQRYKKSMQM